MKIGLTFDLRQDYGIDNNSEVFADFCNPLEIGYLADAIKQCGHTVVMIGNMYKLNEMIISGEFNCDLVFIEDEGILSRNREAVVPALLEVNKIPYIGSDAYAMGLTQNKFHTKLVAQYLGIRTPKCIYVPYMQNDLEEYLINEMRKLEVEFPLVVKPNYEGYSMGVFLVDNMADMVTKIKYNMENYKQAVLCEQYISGEEVNVPIVGTGDEAYVLGIDVCKYEDGSHIDIFTVNDKCFKPIIDEAVSYEGAIDRELEEYSLALHRHLNCLDFGRSDFKIDKYGVPYFLEINPRPGLTQNGPYEICAKAAGKTYVQIIGEIINSAIKRYGMEVK